VPANASLSAKPIKKTGAQGKARPSLKDFSVSGPSRQHGQVLGQMRQGGVGVHMQGPGNFLDMLRGQRAFQLIRADR